MSPQNKFRVPQLVSRSPFYQPEFQFHSSTLGPITLRVSKAFSDWPGFTMLSQAEQFVKGFMVFSQAWLTKKGYGPVSIKIVELSVLK